MDQTNYPSLISLLPPQGVAFYTDRENPIINVSRDLCRVSAFLQELQLYPKLIRIADWWEHDGLYFDKGPLSFHDLFGIVGTPRSLLEAMPGDDLVFVGVSNNDRSWYLRFFVDWDYEDEHLLGGFSLTIDSSLAARFQTNVVSVLQCLVHQAAADEYFARIHAG
jgi:hypothetical protein